MSEGNVALGRTMSHGHVARLALARLAEGRGGWQEVANAVSRITMSIRGGREAPDLLTQNLLLYLWGGADYADGKVYSELHSQIMFRFGRHATRWKWRGWVRWGSALVAMALDEMVDRKACRRCDGQGWLGLSRPCHYCQTTGCIPWSKKDRARVMGVPDSTWNRTWQPRYSWILDLIESCENAGLHSLMAHLSRAKRAV